MRSLSALHFRQIRTCLPGETNGFRHLRQSGVHSLSTFRSGISSFFATLLVSRSKASPPCYRRAVTCRYFIAALWAVRCTQYEQASASWAPRLDSGLLAKFCPLLLPGFSDSASSPRIAHPGERRLRAARREQVTMRHRLRVFHCRFRSNSSKQLLAASALVDTDTQ